MNSPTGLINKTEMLSYPVKRSFCSDLRHLATSSYVAFRGLKLLELFVSDSMWDSMTTSFVWRYSFSPTSLSAVLFWSVFMFMLRIRCMTFQISALFLEDKFFSVKLSFLYLHFSFRFFSLCRFSSFHLLVFYAPHVASDLFRVANCWFWYISSRKLVVWWTFFN